MKKIGKILLSLTIAFLFSTSVDAASGSIRATTNTRVAAVGSTFTVNVRVSSTDALGTWEFGLTYDSAYISLVSGTTHVVGYTADGTQTYKDYSYTFKAIKSGNAGIRINGAQIVDYKTEESFTPSVAGVSVQVKTQAEIQASYSKNNDLKSLSVDDYEISPEFNKDTLEYTVSVPDTVTQIKINAAVADSRARVTGAGTIDISEGANKVSITVTAENGSTKTYTLNVDVRDLNPIDVKVDGEDYTVVKKSDLLSEPVGFSLENITIDDLEIPAYKNERANLVLVGLKNSSGNIELFIYDESTRTYKKYNDLKSSSLTVLPLEIENTMEGFNKETIKINEVDCEVLKSELVDGLYVIYAMNVETGEKGYYQIDLDTNDIIKYNAGSFEKLFKENKEFKLYLIALGVVAGVFFLLTIIFGSKVSKLKKLLRKITYAKAEKDAIIKEETLKEESKTETEDYDDENDEDLNGDDEEYLDEDMNIEKRRSGKKKKNR